MSGGRTWSERLGARVPSSRRGRALVAGLGFGVSGFLVAALILGGVGVLVSPGDVPAVDHELLGAGVGVSLAAGLGAALAGTSLWWQIVADPTEPSPLVGGVIGMAVGWLAHPLMWILAGVGWRLVDLVAGSPGAGHVTVAEVVGSLGAVLVVSVFGMLFTGIVTVPVAAATGAALAIVLRRIPATEGGPGDREPRDL